MPQINTFQNTIFTFKSKYMYGLPTLAHAARYSMLGCGLQGSTSLSFAEGGVVYSESETRLDYV